MCETPPSPTAPRAPGCVASARSRRRAAKLVKNMAALPQDTHTHAHKPGGYACRRMLRLGLGTVGSPAGLETGQWDTAVPDMSGGAVSMTV